MPIAYVNNGAEKDAGATTNTTQAYPGAVTATDLLVAVWMMSSTTGSMTVSDNVNAGNWTQAIRQNQTTDNTSVAIFYKYNTGAGTPTVTFSSDTSASMRVIIEEYSGIRSASDPLDQPKGNQADGVSGVDSITSGNFTTTFADELIFAAPTVDATHLISAGTNFTKRHAVVSAGDANRVMCEDRIVSAIDTYTATASIIDSRNISIAVATFMAPSEAPPASGFKVILTQP